MNIKTKSTYLLRVIVKHLVHIGTTHTICRMRKVTYAYVNTSHLHGPSIVSSTLIQILMALTRNSVEVEEV